MYDFLAKALRNKTDGKNICIDKVQSDFKYLYFSDHDDFTAGFLKSLGHPLNNSIPFGA